MSTTEIHDAYAEAVAAAGTKHTLDVANDSIELSRTMLALGDDHEAKRAAMEAHQAKIKPHVDELEKAVAKAAKVRNRALAALKS